MKKVLCLFIFASLLVSCGEKVEKKTQEKVNEGPTQWLTFDGSDEEAKHIVFVSGDEEYRSEEALPQMAKILSKHHGFKCTVLFAQDSVKPGIVNANYTGNIPGLDALSSADMMVIFTRFRALPDNQMQHIDDYLKSGKPVMGIRTATHAFNFSKDSNSPYQHYSNNYSGDKTEWTDGFGRLILGEKWISHHGHHKHQSTKGILADGDQSHGITKGMANGDIWGSTDVYGVRLPLPGDSQAIVLGQVINRKGEYDENDVFYGMKPSDDEIASVNSNGRRVNDTLMPIAWTKTYQIPEGKTGKAFATTIGSSSDMLVEGTRQLLVNGIFWAMDKPIPEKTNVSLVGEFTPSAYGFQTDEYWLEKQMKIEDLD
jgi:trehalose utilization protein